MTYGTEAMVPAKIGKPSFRTENFDSDINNQGSSLNLDILGIKWDEAQNYMAANQ